MRGLLSEIIAVGALSKHGDTDLMERVREAADTPLPDMPAPRPLAIPVAEICSASHDDAEFGERAIKPLRDISGFEYGMPLYAGAVPAAVAGPAWDKTRDSLAALLLGLARRPFLDFDVACIALDAATEPGMPLAYMRGATAAPALEAPAAPATPVLHDIDAGIEVMAWLRENRAPHSIYCRMSACLFGDPDKRAALAAAPQAPAGLDELRKISEIAACWGCDHPDEPGDTELLRRVKWAARQLRAAQASAAPAVDARDTARMDWLEAQVVNVRAPLRYGSRDLFWASPEEVDGGPDRPSDLRARIDAAQAAAKGT
jgi:hypothetical protein